MTFKSTRTNSSIRSTINLFLLLLCPALLHPVLGQTNPAGEGETAFPSLGVWLVSQNGEPELYVVTKSGGSASLLLASGPDTTLYPGTWQALAARDGISVQFPGRAELDILRSPTGYSGRLMQGGRLEDRSIIRVPSSEVGRWTVPPDGPSGRGGVLAEVEGYFGTWEVNNGGSRYFLIIEDDRGVGCSFNHQRLDGAGMVGTWSKQGDDLHVTFNTGHYLILRQRPQDYLALLFEPGEVIDPNAEIGAPALKVTRQPPADWLAKYRSMRERYERVSGFRNRRQLNNFYQGSWSLQGPRGSAADLSLGRFGGAGLRGDADLSNRGRWSTSGRNVLVRWNNGDRAFINPIHLSVVYSSYQEGDPLDGAPHRVFALQPDSSGKLEAYEERILANSQRLRELREEERAFLDERQRRPGEDPESPFSWIPWVD